MVLPPFIQKRINYKQRFRNNLTPSEYSVMDTISDLILKTEKGRAIMRGEFSCRYLQYYIKLSYSYIAKILRRLVVKGFIEILKKGTAGIGTIYKLILRPDEVIESKKKSKRVHMDTIHNNTINIDSNDPLKISKIIAKNILKKKNLNPDPIINRILPFITSQGNKIKSPEAYLVGAAKKEKNMPAPIKPVGSKTLDIIKQWEQGIVKPIVIKKQVELEIEVKQEQEEQEDFITVKELLKKFHPEELDRIEKQLWKEQGLKWNFTRQIDKAKQIVERFKEVNPLKAL